MKHASEVSASAGLSAESASAVRRLAQLSIQARDCTPACCASTVTLRLTDGMNRTVSTHPDIDALASFEEETGEGPDVDASASSASVWSRDLVTDTRWSRFRYYALGMGLRTFRALAVHGDGMTVVIGLAGYRAGALPASVEPPVRALAEECLDGLVRDHGFASVTAEVDQLKGALATRALVDRATGMVMRALDCDADEAFEILRSISQGTNRKLNQIAQELVDTDSQVLARRLRGIGRRASRAARGGAPRFP
ncbi:ANTAR domain-containing protein [Streptomyces sp. OR43]|uniref:ANTAR domain-containing protein n=1 Tax=Streptomyces sp. or43 TaxID=2478957 RepID=UPI001C9CB9D7|nr:ANTAR domain-containing protein [Streptomyces sp. or43]